MNNSELINQIKQKISRELGNTVDIDVEINTNKYNISTADIDIYDKTTKKLMYSGGISFDSEHSFDFGKLNNVVAKADRTRLNNFVIDSCNANSKSLKDVNLSEQEALAKIIKFDKRFEDPRTQVKYVGKVKNKAGNEMDKYVVGIKGGSNQYNAYFLENGKLSHIGSAPSGTINDAEDFVTYFTNKSFPSAGDFLDWVKLEYGNYKWSNNSDGSMNVFVDGKKYRVYFEYPYNANPKEKCRIKSIKVLDTKMKDYESYVGYEGAEKLKQDIKNYNGNPDVFSYFLKSKQQSSIELMGAIINKKDYFLTMVMKTTTYKGDLEGAKRNAINSVNDIIKTWKLLNYTDKAILKDSLTREETELVDYVIENLAHNGNADKALSLMRGYYAAYSELASRKPNEVKNYFNKHINDSHTAKDKRILFRVTYRDKSYRIKAKDKKDAVVKFIKKFNNK